MKKPLTTKTTILNMGPEGLNAESDRPHYSIKASHAVGSLFYHLFGRVRRHGAARVISADVSNKRMASLLDSALEIQYRVTWYVG